MSLRDKTGTNEELRCITVNCILRDVANVNFTLVLSF